MLQKVVLVVLLAVGVAIGWIVSNSREPVGSRDPARSQVPEDPAVDPKLSVPAPSEGELTGTADRLSGFGDLQLDFVGTITGLVVDAGGAPLPGAEVVARVSEMPDGQGPKSALELTLEEYVRHELRRATYRRETERRTQTNSEGRFTLERIGPVAYAISAECEGFLIRAGDEAQLNRVETGADLQLIAHPAGTIEVQLTTPDGSSPGRIALNIEQGGNESTQIQWRPEQPTLVALVGSVTLSADSIDWVSEPVTVVVRQGEVVRASVSLRHRLGVRGHVVRASGEPVESGMIRLLRNSGSVTADTLLQSPEVKVASYAAGNPFEITVEEPGSYAIAFGRGRDRIDSLRTVEIEGGMLDLELVVEDPDPREVLIVRALDPRGEPLEDLSFSLVLVSDQSSWSRGHAGAVQPDGSYLVFPEMELLRRWREESGRVTLTVQSAEFGSETADLDPIDLRVEVQFAEPAELEVRVVGLVGHSLQGLVSVALASTREGGRAYSTAKPDGEGIARVPSVAPGEYFLRLQVLGNRDRWNQSTVHEETIQLAPGPNSATLTLPSLYRLVVTFAEVGAIRMVSLQGVEGGSGWRNVEVDLAKREVVFENVAAGRYQVQRFGGMSEQMTVDVASDLTVEFAADQVNALAVTVTDTSGTLATAGFLDGDLIVALDGREFANQTELSFAMIGMMTQNEVTLTIRRGRTSVDLTVAPSEMMRGNMGGNIAPATK